MGKIKFTPTGPSYYGRGLAQSLAQLGAGYSSASEIDVPGATSLFLDDFETGALSDAGRWQDIVGSDGFTIVVAADEGIAAYSGVKVLRVNGSAGVITHFLASPVDRLCHAFRIRMTNTTGALRYGMIRGSESQWGSFGVGGYCPINENTPPLFEQFFALSLVSYSQTPFGLQLYNYWYGMTAYEGGLCYGRTAQAGTGSPVATYYNTSYFPAAGQWHYVESEVMMNTVGQANGWQRVWVDGALLIEHLNVIYRTKPTVQIRAISHDFNTPGQTCYLDNVQALTARAA